jgi:hypothetical protein
MDYCPVCKSSDELLVTRHSGGYCYRCGVSIQPEDQITDEDEPTAEQTQALTAYIAAREEWEGLKDDIRWGSFREANEARRNLSNASNAYRLARDNASIVGVLSVGRSMFR